MAAKRGPTGETTEAVRQLLERGLAQSQVATILGLSRPTVCYHARKLGIPADSRFHRRYDWAEIQRLYDKGLSVRECAAGFGFNLATWAKAVDRGDVVARPRAAPVDELFVRGRRRNRGHLKKRLFDAGLRDARCEACGLSEWLGRPIGLELHHINGDNDDNRLENLSLLCGNCHAQTPNWGGRGVGRKAA